MNYRINVCAIALIAVVCADQSAFAQNGQQFQDHIKFLASDSLNGREVGTAYERIAAAYIVEHFQSWGLEPRGDKGTYYQEFDFSDRPNMLPDSNLLQIGRKRYKLGEDYYPVSFSANGGVLSKVSNALYGIVAPEKDYDDTQGRKIEGRAVAISISSPDGIHPHSEYIEHHDLQGRVAKLAAMGAKAVILYNDDPTAEAPKNELSEFVSVSEIPVIFLDVPDVSDVLLDNNPFVLRVDIERPIKQGVNVVGFLNNQADRTVIIGAHFDHLGLGSAGGSLFAGEGEIHNGADDNASGTSMMLELAEELSKRERSTTSNYLFIGFTGEERGLYGSNHFSNYPSVKLDSVSYMLNFDMVGRLDTSMVLGINGVGTSPAWDFIEELDVSPIKIKTTESGIGPSDHSSFYKKGIPAIHFFSGTHSDYHKPSDDEHLINYNGMALIKDVVYAIIDGMEEVEDPAFTQTSENKGMGSMRFTVTLGVIPDYLFDGKGMRIDGVKEDKPASNAGLKVGDVVKALGEFQVHDMMSYMDALGKFKKGDKTSVTVLRGEEELRSELQF